MQGNLGGRQVDLSLMYMYAAVKLKEKNNVCKYPYVREKELEPRNELWYSFFRVFFFFFWIGGGVARRVHGTEILVESSFCGQISNGLKH